MRLNIQRFASGTIEFAKKIGNANWKWIQGKIEWSSKSNGSEANTSTVTTKLYTRVGTGGTSGKQWGGSVKVGSNPTHSFSSLPSKDVASNWVLFQTYTDTIPHNSDGTCSIEISGSVIGCKGTSIDGLTSSGKQTVRLDTIPRASTLDSFSGNKRIGVSNDVIINFTKRNPNFTTTIEYSLNSSLTNRTTIANKIWNNSTFSWTIPINLLNQIPNRQDLPIYIILTTFSDDTQIGDSQSRSFTAYAYAGNCSPIWNTHTIEETDTIAKQLVTTPNKFIASVSKPKFTFSATGQYGATITRYELNGATRTSGFIDGSFNPNGYSLKVIDSRGFTNYYTYQTQVVPYFTPVFEKVTLTRETPTSNKVFSYFKIKFFNNTSSVKLDNPKALNYKFNYTESGGTQQSKTITPTTSDYGTTRTATNESLLADNFNYKKSVAWTFAFVDFTGRTFTTSSSLPMGIPLINGKMNANDEQELYINGDIKGEGANHILTISPSEPDNKTGMWVKASKNLFNKNSSENVAGYLNNKGQVVTANSDTTSGYIEVKPNSEIRKTTRNGIAQYDSNKAFIKYQYDSFAKTEPNCKYIRISVVNKNKDKEMVKYGWESINFEPYVDKEISIYNGSSYESLTDSQEIDIANLKTSNVIGLGRAKIMKLGKLYHINISALKSNKTGKIFDTPVRPRFTTELNVVTSNDGTSRVYMLTNGEIHINPTLVNKEIYINGVVIE